MIVADLARTGKPVNEETIKANQHDLNKALDTMVAEAEQEYAAKEYTSFYMRSLF